MIGIFNPRLVMDISRLASSQRGQLSRRTLIGDRVTSRRPREFWRAGKFNLIEFQINAAKTKLFPQSWPSQGPRLDCRVSKFGTMCLRIEEYRYLRAKVNKEKSTEYRLAIYDIDTNYMQCV